MATVTMMRCTVPHWQGMDFISAGTILAADHPQVIEAFFEPITYENADRPTPKTSTKKT